MFNLTQISNKQLQRIIVRCDNVINKTKLLKASFWITLQLQCYSEQGNRMAKEANGTLTYAACIEDIPL